MTEMVTVGCRAPNGLILRVGLKSVDGNIVDMGKTQRVYGPTNRIIAADGGTIFSGHGITDIPKDFWDAWIKENKDTAIVKEGFIFAQPKEASTRAEAKDKATNMIGLEPYNPAKPAPGDAQIEEGFAKQSQVFRTLAPASA